MQRVPTKQCAMTFAALASAASLFAQNAGLKRVDNHVDDFMIPQIKELSDPYYPDFVFFDGEWDQPEKF
jgi:hypothetical protein